LSLFSTLFKYYRGGVRVSICDNINSSIVAVGVTANADFNGKFDGKINDYRVCSSNLSYGNVLATTVPFRYPFPYGFTLNPAVLQVDETTSDVLFPASDVYYLASTPQVLIHPKGVDSSYSVYAADDFRFMRFVGVPFCLIGQM